MFEAIEYHDRYSVGDEVTTVAVLHSEGMVLSGVDALRGGRLHLPPLQSVRR